MSTPLTAIECGPLEGSRIVNIRRGPGGQSIISFSRKYRVNTRDGRLAISAIGVPRPGDRDDVLPQATARSIEQEFEQSSLSIIITVSYSNEEPDETSTHSPGDVVEVTRTTTKRERAYRDLDGNSVGNEGEGADVEVTHKVYAATCYYDAESVPSDDDMDGIINHVNEAVWRGGAVGQWKCQSGEKRQLTDTLYEISWEFEKDGSDSGWQYEWYAYELVAEEVEDAETVTREYVSDPTVNRLYLTADFDMIYPGQRVEEIEPDPPPAEAP